jgi:Double zinc ribbon
VTDLERFFILLVRNVAAGDPARLAKPLFLVDIRNSILPYRANRRALQMESSEDYELALLRFCAGEGGFARTGPDEVHDEFVKELASSNPDLTVIQRHEDAVVHLDAKAVAKALDPEPELAFAPPDQRHAPPAQKKPPATPVRSVGRSGSSKTCGVCGGKLPSGRSAKFCPHCGKSQTSSRCPGCQAELEAGWRHCVSCGASLPAN